MPTLSSLQTLLTHMTLDHGLTSMTLPFPAKMSHTIILEALNPLNPKR